MLVLILLFYLVVNDALANPTHALHSNVSNSSSFELSIISAPSLVPRKTLQIIWSCIAAIISCTWVAIHPSIEFHGHLGAVKWLLRRIYLMILTVLAPELMSFWAYMQYRAAKASLEKISGLKKSEL